MGWVGALVCAAPTVLGFILLVTQPFRVWAKLRHI